MYITLLLLQWSLMDKHVFDITDRTEIENII